MLHSWSSLESLISTTLLNNISVVNELTIESLAFKIRLVI